MLATTFVKHLITGLMEITYLNRRRGTKHYIISAIAIGTIFVGITFITFIT
jgi:hypothetical protein